MAEYPALAPMIQANLRQAQRRAQRRARQQRAQPDLPPAPEPVQTLAAQANPSPPYSATPATLYQRKRQTLHEAIATPELTAALQAADQAVAALLADSAAHGSDPARSATTAPPPLVSVIMPTHNRAPVIGEAITTLLEQRYPRWELWVCDDASTDDTAAVVAGFAQPRIALLRLPKVGAAAARNAGLARARGALIAYLDSDNDWHPDYLATMVALLQRYPGHSAAYADDLDYAVDAAGQLSLKGFARAPFDHEALLVKPRFDLNSFVHRRELYDCFGGFNPELRRRQDYDLILKYSWLRDPLHFPHPLNLYQRHAGLRQITWEQRHDRQSVERVERAVSGYFQHGLPRLRPAPIQRLTILSWDLCRNHFSKAFALAEALSADYQVQLLAFQFFDEPLFAPLRGEQPRFETCYLPGGRFPDFAATLDQAVAAITGEVVYALKPRLPSLGLALLANARRGLPLLLECNDLETVVQTPGAGRHHQGLPLEALEAGGPELLNPYAERWSQLLDPLVASLPVVLTHNQTLDAHYGRRCLYMRNLKDEAVYDPSAYDRAQVRAELGYRAEDRVILFGGLLREHKGVFELLRLLEHLADPRYQLLFVASRPSAEQARLARLCGEPGRLLPGRSGGEPAESGRLLPGQSGREPAESGRLLPGRSGGERAEPVRLLPAPSGGEPAERVRLLPAQSRTEMARLNLAADLVILWLDPQVPASHYQMPYKATDAWAMGTPIIANPISDLEVLGRQGYLRLVPYGDLPALREAITALFADPEATQQLREAGQRLFRRQCSYAAARANLDLALYRLQQGGILPVAERFRAAFDRFRAGLAGRR